MRSSLPARPPAVNSARRSSYMNRTVITYLLIAIAVVVLGALAGWYFFLRSQGAAVASLKSGLGLGTQAPFGIPVGTSPAAEQSGAVSGSTSAPPQMWRVATAPVAGFTFATSTEGAVVRYVERATGYVFEANLKTGAISRLTNMLMPKIYEAYLTADGRVVERSVSEGAITTFAGTFENTASSTLAGSSLQNNIYALAPSPDTARMFSIVAKGRGVSGVVSNWDGSGQKEVFSSAVPGWRAQWLPDGRIVVVQKAVDSLPGYAYSIRGNTVSSLLEDIPGLTLLPRSDSGALLYGTSLGGALSLYVQQSATTSAVRLPLTTLADKCAWMPGRALIAYCGVPQSSPASDFLDRWYRGEVHQADTLWRIDASSGRVEQAFAPAANSPVDIDLVAVDQSGAYLGFVNSADLSLWVLRFEK